MTMICTLPLGPEDRALFLRAAREEFAEMCLRMDWREAIRARENWSAETFVDQVLFFGMPLPVSRDYAFRLIGPRVALHVRSDLITPDAASVN